MPDNMVNYHKDKTCYPEISIIKELMLHPVSNDVTSICYWIEDKDKHLYFFGSSYPDQETIDRYHYFL